MNLAPTLAALALALVSSPRTTVAHFLQPDSPADLCAQLTVRYRKRLDRQYGPCLRTVGRNEKATALVFVAVRATGPKATAEVRYTFRHRRYHERFALLLQQGRWRIDDARLLPRDLTR